MDNDELKWTIKEIQDRSDQLNGWEETFLASIEERFKSNKPLTEKQEAKLHTIYERVTENG